MKILHSNALFWHKMWKNFLVRDHSLLLPFCPLFQSFGSATEFKWDITARRWHRMDSWYALWKHYVSSNRDYIDYIVFIKQSALASHTWSLISPTIAQHSLYRR